MNHRLIAAAQAFIDEMEKAGKLRGGSVGQWTDRSVVIDFSTKRHDGQFFLKGLRFSEVEKEEKENKEDVCGPVHL